MMQHRTPTANSCTAKCLGLTALQPIVIAIIVLGLLTGCVRTQLHGAPLGDGFVRLAAAAPKKIQVSVQVPAQQVTVGRQWVFFILPLGQIQVADEAQRISVAIFKQLALRGYSPTIIPATEPLNTAPHHSPAEITISSVLTRCSVPDLFFARIVRCSVTVAGSSAAAPEVSLSSSAESSHMRMVGFKPQIEHELEHATAEALDGLLDQMHL
jgi:hypothetical protein